MSPLRSALILAVQMASKFCVPKFYASPNFESYSFHDSQPQRFYFVIREPLAGDKAAIYSLKCIVCPFIFRLVELIFGGGLLQRTLSLMLAHSRFCAAKR